MTLTLLKTATETDLGARIRRRDRAVWDELVDCEHARIFNLHLRLTADRETAADLTQETFAAAYESARSFAGRSRPEAWLYGVAMNVNRGWRRKAGQREPEGQLDEDLADPQPSAAQLAELRERSDLVCEAVRRLPEIYRRVVALRYFAGVPATEIAAAEGVDPGTIRWRLHHATRKLWAMLQPALGEECGNGSGQDGRLRIAP